MSFRLITKIGVGVVCFTVIALIAAMWLIKAHVYRIYGGRVQLVDPTQFETQILPTAITHVSVLSPDGEKMLGDRVVILDQGKIISVSQVTPALDGMLVIDGSGKFLIPGLIDSHVHLRRQPNDLLLYIANGVTHIRNMSGSKRDLALRDELEEGRIGPHMYVASPMLFTSGRLSGWYTVLTGPWRNVGNAKHAKAVVLSLAEAGYDALKTYYNIDIDTYRAINKAAKEIGLYTTGHLPEDMKLDELRTTDQREIAHIEEIIKKLQNEFTAADIGDYSDEFPSFVEGREDAIIDDLLANDLTVNSTLWFMEIVGKQAFDLENQLKSIPLEYANPGMVEGSPYVLVGWLPGRNKFEVTDEVTPEKKIAIERSWEARAEAHRVLFRKMVRRGVRVIAGTDATVNLVIPGFSLHNELESLTRNGMTPAQSLRAATATPARLMKSNEGIIEAGRRADLVLLTENPLTDITNTKTIEAVILGGRYLDRERLDEMLESVKEANASSRKFDLELYQ